jgi:hypothetical protein
MALVIMLTTQKPARYSDAIQSLRNLQTSSPKSWRLRSLALDGLPERSSKIRSRPLHYVNTVSKVAFHLPVDDLAGRWSNSIVEEWSRFFA